ncbi:MAG: hypothetical protein GY749_15675 [Desulfobacteraceae bacterium]|nr:hypothetical protein [Desulfobacteraceae bacterium]
MGTRKIYKIEYYNRINAGEGTEVLILASDGRGNLWDLLKDFLIHMILKNGIRKVITMAKRAGQDLNCLFPFGTKRIKEAYHKGYDDALNNVVNIEYFEESSTLEKVTQLLRNIND